MHFYSFEYICFFYNSFHFYYIDKRCLMIYYDLLIYYFYLASLNVSRTTDLQQMIFPFEFSSRGYSRIGLDHLIQYQVQK